ELVADRVVAACDPQRVLVDWLDGPPPAARRMVDRWRSRPVQEGYESKLDVVLAELPRWRAADVLDAVAPGADLLSPTSVISRAPTELAEAHALRVAGRVAARPTMLVNVPSGLDPDMQPRADQHVLSLEVLFTPYALAGGWA